MKIAFFGTSEFGGEALKKLHENFGVEFVVTGVAKQANRGKKLTNTPIFELAKSLGIERIYTPEKLTEEFDKRLENIDFAVVVSFGMILPERILNSAKNFVNLHPSSLPLFRGAAPIERTIEAGHKTTDVCVIKMTRKLDAGNIVARQGYEILESDNSITLHERFGKIGANLMVDLIKNGSTMEEIQNDEAAIYAKKIEKFELELKDLSHSTIDILNKIRAFASCGYCFKVYETRRFKFISAQISKTRLTKIDIQCADGFVSPLIIRPEGKGNLGVKDYQF
jgi:methionyl-tRNA formyltransferase